MSRIRFLLVLLLLLQALGCSSSPRSRVVLVFVDISASVKDFVVYRDAWARIVSSLQPGDRLILAPISDRTYTAFHPVLDQEIPRFDYLRDNKLLHEKRLTGAKAGYASKFEETLASPRSAKTDIFGALLEAGKIFKGDRRQPVLVLLSDMIQD